MASVLGLMIPSFLKGQKRRWIVVKDYDKLHPVLHQLFNGKTRINIDNKILEQYSLIKKEIAKENITLEYDLFTYGKTKKQRLYSVKNSIIFKKAPYIEKFFSMRIFFKKSFSISCGRLSV